MSGRERAADPAGVQRYIKPVAIGAVVGILVCIAALLLFAAILSTRNIPQSLISPMATIAILLGGFAGGMTCAKLTRKKGLLCGLVCGVLMSFVLLLASFGISESGLGVLALFKIAFILLSAMLGGVLGVNTRKKRRKK